MFVKALPEQCKIGCRALAAAAVLPALLAGAAHAGVGGRIWSTATEAFVEPAVVERAVAGADHVLLGEAHTIERHHALQARLLAVAAEQRRPALVLEMVGRDDQAAIDRWRRDGARPKAFGPAVGWADRGWPDWAMYQPIVEVAVRHDLPVRAGGPARAVTRRVARQGLSALEPARRRALGLDRALPRAARRHLRRTLVEAHCGPPTHVPLERMIAVQRLRDAVMAERMRAAGNGGAVLIAGHGHTRRDYGVPHYLDGSDAGLVTVAFMGSTGTTTVAEVRERMHGGLAHDYVWFTKDPPPEVACPDAGAEHGEPAG